MLLSEREIKKKTHNLFLEVFEPHFLPRIGGSDRTSQGMYQIRLFQKLKPTQDSMGAGTLLVPGEGGESPFQFYFAFYEME